MEDFLWWKLTSFLHNYITRLILSNICAIYTLTFKEAKARWLTDLLKYLLWSEITQRPRHNLFNSITKNVVSQISFTLKFVTANITFLLKSKKKKKSFKVTFNHPKNIGYGTTGSIW